MATQIHQIVCILRENRYPNIYSLPFSTIKGFVESKSNGTELNQLATEYDYRHRFRELIFCRIENGFSESDLQLLFNGYKVENKNELLELIECSIYEKSLDEMQKMIKVQITAGKILKKCDVCGSIMYKQCNICIVNDNDEATQIYGITSKPLWAYLLARGLKKVENKSRGFHVKHLHKPLYLHASNTSLTRAQRHANYAIPIVTNDLKQDENTMHMWYDYNKLDEFFDSLRGSILCIISFARFVYRKDDVDAFISQYQYANIPQIAKCYWIVENVMALSAPIKNYKGQLGVTEMKDQSTISQISPFIQSFLELTKSENALGGIRACKACNSLYVNKCSKCMPLKTLSSNPLLFNVNNMKVNIYESSDVSEKYLYFSTQQIQTKRIETHDSIIGILSPTIPHQSLYLRSSDICGPNMILHFAIYSYFKNIINNATNILYRKMMNIETTTNPSVRNEVLPLYRFHCVLQILNDRIKWEYDLDQLAYFIKKNGLNAQLDNDEHPLYKMSVPEIESTLRSNPQFKCKNLVILPCAEAIGIAWKRGELLFDELIATLNDHVVTANTTPPFCVQYKEHYFLIRIALMDTLSVVIGNKSKKMIKIVNFDGKNPSCSVLGGGRPFATLANFIVNYHNLQNDKMYCLRLVEQIKSVSLTLLRKKKTGQQYLANIFGYFINNNTLPFEFVEEPDIIVQKHTEKRMSYDLKQNINYQFHTNRSDKHYLKYLAIYMETLHTETMKVLKNVIYLNQKLLLINVGIKLFSKISTFLNEYKRNTSEWDSTVLNTLDVWHCFYERIGFEIWSPNKIESELERLLPLLDQITSTLYDGLFKIETMMALRDVQCETCIEVIKNL